MITATQPLPDTDTCLAELCTRLAAALTVDGGLQGLLTDLLRPIALQARARAASVSVRGAEDGRMNQLGAINLALAGAATEARALQLPLTHRGRVLGCYELLLDVGVETNETTARFHRSLGALLGLALHDACAERESRQALLADVHDGIAQTLSFARMRMPLLEAAISSADNSKALHHCDELRQALGAAHTNLRAILTQCHAPVDPKGLKHALSASLRTFHEQTQVDLVFDDNAPDLRLSTSQESQVFLIVQEALANIAKHAHARHAWLHIAQRGDQIQIVVEDDGSGPPACAEAAPLSHFGMEIMRQRAARLGGVVEVAAREGGGLRLHLSFPATEAAVA